MTCTKPANYLADECVMQLLIFKNLLQNKAAKKQLPGYLSAICFVCSLTLFAIFSVITHKSKLGPLQKNTSQPHFGTKLDEKRETSQSQFKLSNASQSNPFVCHHLCVQLYVVLHQVHSFYKLTVFSLSIEKIIP